MSGKGRGEEIIRKRRWWRLGDEGRREKKEEEREVTKSARNTHLAQISAKLGYPEKGPNMWDKNFVAKKTNFS